MHWHPAQALIIWIITACASASVILGLDKGLKTISIITFTLGNLLLFSLVYLVCVLHVCFLLLQIDGLRRNDMKLIIAAPSDLNGMCSILF